jgi:hypothetical protein
VRKLYAECRLLAAPPAEGKQGTAERTCCANIAKPSMPLVCLLHALAHNMMQAHGMRAATA